MNTSSFITLSLPSTLAFPVSIKTKLQPVNAPNHSEEARLQQQVTEGATWMIMRLHLSSVQ